MEKAKELQENIHFCFIDYTKALDCVDHNKLEHSFLFFFELNLIVFIISFCLFILNFFYLFITLQYWIAFAIRQHESTMGIHKFQDWNILKETKIPHHHVCLLRNLYVCQEAIEPDMEQCTVSKLGKEYIKGIYFHQIT